MFATKVSGFVGHSRHKVAAEISTWSDHNIHQAAREHKALSKYLIPNHHFLASAKMRRFMALIKQKYEAGEKVLVFSQFTMYLDLISESLERHLNHVGYCRLDGDTPMGQRQLMVTRFTKDPTVIVFLLSTKAGGTGLNLTAAATVILMDQDWNPHVDRQAEDRVHRLGQTQAVTVHRLYCRGTVEEAILRCCHQKLNLDEAFGGDCETLQAAILHNSLELTKMLSPSPKKSVVCSDGDGDGDVGDSDEGATGNQFDASSTSQLKLSC